MKLERMTTPCPLVATVTMGYGHLRAAYPLAEALGTEVVPVDESPIADAGEVSLWAWVRRMHEALSKPVRLLGALDRPTRGLMDALTMIPPLHEPRDHREPSWSVRLLDTMIRQGLGRGMVEHLQRVGGPLVTTFYAPAIIADKAGISDIHCVVTDADCNRVWAPLDAASSSINYLAPTRRVVRRLRSFGVPERNITLTGFPLPPSLTAATPLDSPKARLARRVARLDPGGTFRSLLRGELAMMLPDVPENEALGPIVLMFAVGGAGAQAEIAAEFLPSLGPRILEGKLCVQLVAGTRPDVRRSFLEMVHKCGLSHSVGREVRIIYGENFEEYYSFLNRALLETDILWTKPSEMSFYPALGIPCIIAPPVGAHERYNRRWLREQGVGLKQRRPDLALGWIDEWLEDGTLAAAAWSGFTRLPKHGTAMIAQVVRSEAEPEQLPLHHATA